MQLWLALPDADEEIDPAFYHYPSPDIPALNLEGVKVRVLVGSAYGVSSPVKTFFETLYIEADLAEGQTLRLPYADERGLYVASGEVCLSETPIKAHQMAVLTQHQDILITASSATRIALIGGQGIGKRYMEWNFVSSRKERIEQAKQDWQQGRFAKVPGDEDEFIPYPTVD
ncbi:pirin family protein [Nitrincola nitratireducens]|uniref:Pirin C-terminal domain-containing protein n=1 Tax=Nitrincola nitratireducens TaxID=1229521 RepID=W9UVN6_9GAMM|nr:pirin-like C-terminal cupin domain-containing protein [Nitrincola nitratireducens]EXJ11144.1 hypothetical protein D791_01930 [Nitrincola nitratireducens]